MEEREALMRCFIDDPRNRVAMLAFADWLDEHNECGESMRWAVRTGRRPSRYRDIQGRLAGRDREWTWWFGDRRGYPETLPARLRTFMKVGKAGSLWFARFPTAFEAWDTFIRAFGECFRLGEIGYRRPRKQRSR